MEEEPFFEGTSIQVAPEHVSSHHLKSEFRENSHDFLEDLVGNMFSTVAAQSVFGQGLSFFCPEIIFGGDDSCAIFLFGILLDGISERDWIKRSVAKPAKAEFQ